MSNPASKPHSLRVTLLRELVMRHQDAYHMLLQSHQMESMMDEWVRGGSDNTDRVLADMRCLDAMARRGR